MLHEHVAQAQRVRRERGVAADRAAHLPVPPDLGAPDRAARGVGDEQRAVAVEGEPVGDDRLRAAGRERARIAADAGGVGHRLHAEHLLGWAAATPDPPDATLTLTAIGHPERAALVEGNPVGARYVSGEHGRDRRARGARPQPVDAGRVGDVQVAALVERQPGRAARRGDRPHRHRAAAARRHAHDRAVAGRRCARASRGCPCRRRSAPPARACSCGLSSTRRRPRAGGSRRLPSCGRPRQSILRVWLQPPSRRRAE